MNIRNGAKLCAEAKRRLDQPGWYRLFGLHAAVILGANLLVFLLRIALDAGMADAGGLSGMGTRSLLDSIGSFVETVVTILLPFWQLGLVYLSIQFARKEATDKQTLLHGFRRFKPALRLMLVELLFMMGAAVVVSQVLVYVMMLMPQMEQAVQQMTPMLESGEAIQPEAVMELMEQMLQTMLPAVLLCVAVFMAVWLFLSFRMRLAEYMIISGDTDRAFFAVRSSWRMTRGNCFALLRLDLRFWWLYLMDGLMMALLYLDLLLPAMGIYLPIDPQVFSWAVYLLYLVLRLAVDTFLLPKRHVTYALAYEALAHPAEE